MQTKPIQPPAQQSTARNGLAASLQGFSSTSNSAAPASASRHPQQKALLVSQPAVAKQNKTLVLKVVMTSPAVRSTVEDALLSVRGVVSFTFDGEGSSFTVRARKDVEVEMLFDAILDSDDRIDVCQVVKTPDGKETFVHPWREEEDEEEDEDTENQGENSTPAKGTPSGKRTPSKRAVEDEDGYCDEDLDEESKKKGALTLQGHDYEADDQRQKGWFGGIGSYLTKSIWG